MNFDSLMVIWIIYSLYGFYAAYNQISKKGNTNGLTPWLWPMGSFVWADAIVLAPFWIICSIFLIGFKDPILVLLTYSVFWFIRCLGEMIYWINQQFSSIIREPADSLPMSSFFKNESIWFVRQVIAQIGAVISFVVTLYLFKLWLNG